MQKVYFAMGARSGAKARTPSDAFREWLEDPRTLNPEQCIIVEITMADEAPDLWEFCTIGPEGEILRPVSSDIKSHTMKLDPKLLERMGELTSALDDVVFDLTGDLRKVFKEGPKVTVEWKGDI